MFKINVISSLVIKKMSTLTIGAFGSYWNDKGRKVSTNGLVNI